MPGEVSTVISTLIETVTEALTCSECTTSTTTSETSSTSAPAVPSPESFCLKVATPNSPLFNSRVVYNGARNFWLRPEEDYEPIRFSIIDRNQLVTNVNGANLYAAITTESTPFSYLKEVDSSPTYGALFCSARTDIAGYQGQRIMRCSANLGADTFDRFVVHQPFGNSFLALTPAGTPNQAGIFQVEMAIETYCPQIK